MVLKRRKTSKNGEVTLRQGEDKAPSVTKRGKGTKRKKKKKKKKSFLPRRRTFAPEGDPKLVGLVKDYSATNSVYCIFSAQYASPRTKWSENYPVPLSHLGAAAHLDVEKVFQNNKFTQPWYFLVLDDAQNVIARDGDALRSHLHLLKGEDNSGNVSFLSLPLGAYDDKGNPAKEWPTGCADDDSFTAVDGKTYQIVGFTDKWMGPTKGQVKLLSSEDSQTVRTVPLSYLGDDFEAANISFHYSLQNEGYDFGLNDNFDPFGLWLFNDPRGSWVMDSSSL